jgi:hypothetical protein
MLNLAGQPKSSAHTGATARVRPRGRQLGGTLFGLIVGLLVGLGIAVAVALSSAGFPVAIASGVAPATSAAAWLAWSLGFAATTVAPITEASGVVTGFASAATQVDVTPSADPAPMVKSSTANITITMTVSARPGGVADTAEADGAVLITTAAGGTVLRFATGHTYVVPTFRARGDITYTTEVAESWNVLLM